MKLIAFYLPQYYPIPENNKWWGEGYTEWSSVAKAKPLYRGHQQPKLPADLGFYDLRLPETRQRQVELAQQAGIHGFCYWHYWFGNGKRLLERPFTEVLETGRPEFPFCLAWANHSWYKKSWNSDTSWFCREALIEQTYPGNDDVVSHFRVLEKAFHDNRYIKVCGKPLFLVFNPLDIPNVNEYIEKWNRLAERSGLHGFHFVAQVRNVSGIEACLKGGYNAVNVSLHHQPFDRLLYSWYGKYIRFINNVLLKIPNKVNYRTSIKLLAHSCFSEVEVYPTIIPNWDHTPRSGTKGRVMHNSTPELFGKHVDDVLSRVTKKPEEHKIIFIKSWNEWGEGNYLEPDMQYGRAYLDELAKRTLPVA